MEERSGFTLEDATYAEDADRVIRALGLWDGAAYVLNVDAGLWHVFAGVTVEGRILSQCQETGREISDEVAARVLATKKLGLCVGCFAFGAREPRLEPPERIRRLIG